jgi:hypothetical protein
VQVSSLIVSSIELVYRLLLEQAQYSYRYESYIRPAVAKSLVIIVHSHMSRGRPGSLSHCLERPRSNSRSVTNPTAIHTLYKLPDCVPVGLVVASTPWDKVEKNQKWAHRQCGCFSFCRAPCLHPIHGSETRKKFCGSKPCSTCRFVCVG